MEHRALVPYAHVADIQRSIAFYQQLGFSVANAHPEDSKTPIWVWLNAGKANLMLSAASAPIVASEQAVFFYLYVHDVKAFRDRVIEAGIAAGPLEHPFYLPLGEFRVHDPDGYGVTVAQLD
jgi:catechol 2,3-dioxygenase-like lactoylglutathione lyase family enzyme